jgi:hypothetical protein
MIKLPNAWVGNEAVKVLWLPEWNDLYPSRLGGFSKNTGHDHGDAMPALFEHPPQPDKGQYITGAAKGEKGYV